MAETDPDAFYAAMIEAYKDAGYGDLAESIKQSRSDFHLMSHDQLREKSEVAMKETLEALCKAPHWKNLFLLKLAGKAAIDDSTTRTVALAIEYAFISTLLSQDKK